MRYTQHIFFSDEIVQKDDIDTLFEKLEQLEPPSSLIERILKLTIELPCIPPHPDDPALAPYDQWTDLDGLVIRNDKRSPS